jgi:tRNA(Ile)-lysidine synthase
MKKTENNLRQWRYGEFQKIIDQNHIDFIMTGHNLTDRIESSFMNMFRGAGLNGFLSMRFLDTNSLLQNVEIIRPLLDFTKKQIEEFCVKLDIPFVVDQTNLDSKTSLRNKIRLELLPEFQKLSHSDVSFFDSMRSIYNELENQDSDI